MSLWVLKLFRSLSTEYYRLTKGVGLVLKIPPPYMASTPLDAGILPAHIKATIWSKFSKIPKLGPTTVHPADYCSPGRLLVTRPTTGNSAYYWSLGRLLVTRPTTGLPTDYWSPSRLLFTRPTVDKFTLFSVSKVF
jgi:hypothetical protein